MSVTISKCITNSRPVVNAFLNFDLLRHLIIIRGLLVQTVFYPKAAYGRINLSKMSKNKVTKTIVTSPEIYKPVGPYSQAILADKTLYVSGVLGLDPQAQMVVGGAEAQARQALSNLSHVLQAGGASLDSVVKTTILLADIQDFQAVNKVYAEFFLRDYPARATYQVGALPMGAAVEIEAIALSGDLVVAEAGPCPCART